MRSLHYQKMANLPLVCYGGRSRGGHFIWRDGKQSLTRFLFVPLLRTKAEYLRNVPSYLLYLIYIYRPSKLSRYLPILNSRSDIYEFRLTLAISNPCSVVSLLGTRIFFIFYTNQENSATTYASYFDFPRIPRETYETKRYHATFLILS